jgi:hypothetical protein
MSNNERKIVKGVVTGLVLGLVTNIQYQDGCCRPGAKDLAVGSEIISEATVVSGICEHEIIEVHPALTVEEILRKVEQRKTSATPVAEVVDADIIAKAKIPPKLPPSTPVQTSTPVEQRFDDGELDEEDIRQLQIAMQQRDYEPVGNSKPISPFEPVFDAPQMQPAKRGEKQNWFDDGFDPRGGAGPQRRW